MQNICTNNYCKFILKFFRHVVVLIQTGRCVRLTTLPPSCADCFENLQPQPPGTLRDPGLYRDCFTFATECEGLVNSVQ